MLDTSKIPEALAESIQAFVGQLELGALDDALASLQQVKAHLSDSELYVSDVPLNLAYEKRQNKILNAFLQKKEENANFPSFLPLSVPVPFKSKFEEFSARDFYKYRRLNSEILSNKFAPVAGQKALAMGVLSFLARQNVRAPVLIKTDESAIDKAVEIMFLMLELNAFIMLDLVFEDKKAVTVNPLLAYLIKV